jgi:hypothetical protein
LGGHISEIFEKLGQRYSKLDEDSESSLYLGSIVVDITAVNVIFLEKFFKCLGIEKKELC